MSDAAEPSPPPSVPAPAPQVISPDGRFWWNGVAWAPRPGAAVAAAAGGRSPAVHALASAVVPGLGTMLAGRLWRGLALLAASLAVWVGVILVVVTTSSANPPAVSCSQAEHLAGLSGTAGTCIDLGDLSGGLAWIGILALVGTVVWVLSIVDGYRSAERAHRGPGPTGMVPAA